MKGNTLKKPVLLAYNLSEERAKQIAPLTEKHAIRLRPVPQAEYGRTLADLVAEQSAAYEPYAGEGFDSEMLVLAHFPSTLINQFLDAFRQAGVPSVRLKAVLTDNNSQWHSAHLHGELSQEEAYFRAMRQEAQRREREGQK